MTPEQHAQRHVRYRLALLNAQLDAETATALTIAFIQADAMRELEPDGPPTLTVERGTRKP